MLGAGDDDLGLSADVDGSSRITLVINRNVDKRDMPKRIAIVDSDEEADKISDEVLHEINKTVFGVKSTARMNSKDFTEYMDKVLAFWIEKTHGFFVPKETTKSYLEKTGLV